MNFRKLSGLISLALLPVAANAQLYQDASNSTAVVVRDPARQASTEIDAVIYNPAGTAFLDDGWHFSLNGNAQIQTVSNYSNQSGVETLNRHVYANPSFQIAYKTRRWTISGSVAEEGGWTFENANGISIGESMRYNTYNYSSKLANRTLRVGAAYQFSKHLSVYLGLRGNYVFYTSSFDVENILQSSITSTNYTDVVNYGDLKKIGGAPIISIDGHWNNLNIAVKCEPSIMRFSGDGIYPAFRIPHVLSAGMTWEICDPLKISLGGTLHLKTDEAFGTEKMEYNNSPEGKIPIEINFQGNENKTRYIISGSLSYNLTNNFLVSLGYSYGNALCPTIYSISPMPTFDKSYRKCSFGFKYDVSDKIQLNMGASITLLTRKGTTTCLKEAYNPWIKSHQIKEPINISFGIDYKL